MKQFVMTNEEIVKELTNSECRERLLEYMNRFDEIERRLDPIDVKESVDVDFLANCFARKNFLMQPIVWDAYKMGLVDALKEFERLYMIAFKKKHENTTVPTEERAGSVKNREKDIFYEVVRIGDKSYKQLLLDMSNYD